MLANHQVLKKSIGKFKNFSFFVYTKTQCVPSAQSLSKYISAHLLTVVAITTCCKNEQSYPSEVQEYKLQTYQVSMIFKRYLKIVLGNYFLDLGSVLLPLKLQYFTKLHSNVDKSEPWSLNTVMTKNKFKVTAFISLYAMVAHVFVGECQSFVSLDLYRKYTI